MIENTPSIVERILELPPHKPLEFDKNKILHPKKMGFRRSFGAFKGQLADYRFKLADGRSIHARMYWSKWSIHWDKIDPLVSISKHMRVDARKYYDLTSTLIGISIGALMTGGTYLLINHKKKSE